jgi:hypothetical protein
MADERHRDMPGLGRWDRPWNRTLGRQEQPAKGRPQQPQGQNLGYAAFRRGTTSPTMLVIDLLGMLDHAALVAVFAGRNHVQQE